MEGKLYVVGTPIGNLEDVSQRVLRVLSQADYIAAEDTRHTGILLSQFEIKTPQFSYHKFNEAKRQNQMLDRFREGQTIALVSDAGMPGISDPGERLIKSCLNEGVEVEVIPGPSAVIHALVASGFSSTPFYFGGFVPVKSGGRSREIGEAIERKCTSVYFESPYRLIKTLEVCHEVDPGRVVCVARELTKKFEEVTRGISSEVLERYGNGKIKGELCLVISGANERH